MPGPKPASWRPALGMPSVIGEGPGPSSLGWGFWISVARLPVAVQLWTLQARLASEAGEGERVHALLGRALRFARREMLRTALTSISPWLWGLDEPPTGSLAKASDVPVSMHARIATGRRAEPSELPAAALFEALTGRELQILERLA